MSKPPLDNRIKRPFTYVPAIATDVRKTLRRARDKLQAQQTVRVPALDVDEVRQVQRPLRRVA